MLETIPNMITDPASSEKKLTSSAASRVWLWMGDESTFSDDVLRAGSAVSSLVKDFSVFSVKSELRTQCQKAQNNTDVSLPDAYWKFMMDVKVGDIVVVFRNRRMGGRNCHEMLGWGTVQSDIIHVAGDEFPIQRKIEWNLPRPDAPVVDTALHNSLFFHGCSEEQGLNIKRLLGIDSATDGRSYWFAGYAFGGSDSQLDRFLADGCWEGKGDRSTNDLIEQMRKGDVILLKSTSTKGKEHDKPFIRIKAVGVIESDAGQTASGHYMFKVRYITCEEKDFDGNTYGRYRRTLHLCNEPEIMEWVNSLLGGHEILDMDKEKYRRYIDLLVENRNLVLTGAPGTGKTYLAKVVADAMGAETEFVQFHPSYDYTDFVEGLRPTRNGSFERRDGLFKEFCKKALRNLQDSAKSQEVLTEEKTISEKIDRFLSAATEDASVFTLKNGNKFIIVDYDDHHISVEALDNKKTKDIVIKMSEVKEILEKGVELSVVHDIRDYFGRRFGTQQDSYIFVICTEIKNMKAIESVAAPAVERKDFVFIIDEINRGELSKIFGELFFSIDPGYRGLKGRVKTQYQNLIDEDDEFAGGFFIPENVYILATMNDIDRSVESMDFAMRRRFSWTEITPADRTEMLENLGAYRKAAEERMSRINAVISDTDGLGPAFQIGPAYFLKLKDGDFGRLWEMNIEPLLKEYLRGFRDAQKKLDAFSEAYFGNAKTEDSETATTEYEN